MNTTTVSIVLIVAGALIMLVSIVKSQTLLTNIRLLPADVRNATNALIKVHRALLWFFLIGYLVVAMAVASPIQLVSNVLVGLIFLVGSIFVYLGLVIQLRLSSKIQTSLLGLKTEVVARSDEVRMLHERFLLAKRAARIGVWDWSIADNVLEWDKEMFELYGIEKDQFSGAYDAWREGMHVDDRDRMDAKIQAALAGDTEFDTEFRVVRPDQSIHYVTAHGIVQRDSGGEPVRMIGTNWDITARKKSEAALLESEQRFRRMADAAPALIWLSDADCKCVYVNRCWLELTGLSFQPGIEQWWTTNVHREDGDRYRSIFEKAFQACERFEIEYRLECFNGDYKWILDTGNPLFDGEGEFTGYIGCGIDISSRKRSEEVLKTEKETADAANQAKSEFLATMSHEIRTPMNAVIGMTDLLLETELNAKQQEYLRTLKTAANSLLILISDILDFSKIEARKIEFEHFPFSLRDCIDDRLKTLAVQAHQKGLELAFDIAPDVPDHLLGDPGRLGQIIINLVSNAIKFTESGEVVLRINNAEQQYGADATVGTTAGDSGSCRLQFSVLDTGIGIPAENQSRIFEPFSQSDSSISRRYGGTGLGLAICAELVKLMGGQLSLTSPAGTGTGDGVGSIFKFTIDFQLQPDPPTCVAVPESFRQVPVIVVDDSETTRRIIAAILKSWNMNPVTCENADSALGEMRRMKAKDDRFRLAIIDAGMPDVDGFSLVERTLAEGDLVESIVMLMTAAGTGSRTGLARRLGIRGFVIKPVRDSDLRGAVEQAMGFDKRQTKALPEKEIQTAIWKRIRTSRPLRILLAEDTVFNQTLAVTLLGKGGHKVDVVEDGRQAVDAVNGGSYDLVLMDIQMPNMDGLTATELIRNSEGGGDLHIPIIAMTAYAMKGDRERCLEAGMDDYVTKPVRAEELYTAIARFFPVPEDIPAKSALPSLSDDHLRGIVDIGGDTLLAELIEIFIRTVPERIRSIRQALTNREYNSIAKTAHILISECGHLGAVRMADVARKVEISAKSEDTDAIRQQLEIIADEYSHVENRFSSYLGAGTAGVASGVV